MAVTIPNRMCLTPMIFAAKILVLFFALSLLITPLSIIAQQVATRNIPGNGDPSFHLGGPGQEFNGPKEGVERFVAGACQGKRLELRWAERPRTELGTQRRIWIEELSLNGKNLDTSNLVKFEKIFNPILINGFDIGCKWSQQSDYDFIIYFRASVYYEFSEYWACTLGGPRPSLSDFTWYFYVSEEKGVFNPYVWPTGRLGDNIQSVRGVALEDIKPEDFPDCAAYEETGFPLTLE